MRDYHESDAAGYAELYGPARAPTLHSDAWPAITQGAFVGFVGGGIVAGMAWLYGVGGLWWVLWPLCGAMIALAVWLWRQSVYDQTLLESQRRDNRPLPPVQRFDMGPAGHVLMDGGKVRDALARQNAERGRAAFVAFVRGCEHGPTTARHWEPRVGRKNFRAWRDELIAMGMAEAEGDHENAPWRLTLPAAEIVAALEAGA